jgi:NAD(P)-dependent dehydrogenase (short-subunit alcohol dehydrogenase family)
MNKLDFAGRNAIVTGGAQGIGAAIVKRLQASGAKVIIWDLDGTEVVELTDEASVEAATRATLGKLGRLDVLVNSAGITGGNGTTWELAPDVWRRVIEVNLVGCYLTCRAVVPHMIEAGYGRIVNIASVAGKEGNPNAAAYGAAKGGLITFTKSFGKELAQTGVLVNCVTPAAAKTAIFDQVTEEFTKYMLSKIPMGRFVKVEEIAALACWLASEDCSFTTGGVFDISGGRATY